MKIEIQTDFGGIKKKLKEQYRAEKWTYIAGVVYSRVLRLINESKNVDGQKFEPYSKSYAKLRVRRDLSATVNLQWGKDDSRRMVQNIVFKGNKNGFAIFINGELNNKKAIWLNGSKNWKFFEWGKELEKELEKALKKIFEI